MKKKAIIIFVALALLSVVFVPTSVVKAGPGFTHPAAIQASFCGSNYYFESTDYPYYFVDAVQVFSPDGSFVEEIGVFGHDAESVDVGYPIGSLSIIWGADGYHRIQAFSVDAPSCGGTGLINMYVYYSATPFFGETNTITLYSADGFPSREAVTAAAGGKLPDGFTFGAPACWGALVDNGTDKGFFACDSFLANLGERRAWLRNDPEGPGFDLLPKIHSYIGMLNGLGITPEYPGGTTELTPLPFEFD